jgi:hypothetical protein
VAAEDDTAKLSERFAGIGGLVLGTSENRTWIELFYEGDLMHTRRVDLDDEGDFAIFIEEIPHKTTVYEHPRTMIYFDKPCDLEICRDGSRVILRGARSEPTAE